MKLDNIKNRWTPMPRENFHEKEYTRCDGLRVALVPSPVGGSPWSEIAWPNGVLWSPEVGLRVITEARKRDVSTQGRYLGTTDFWKKEYDDAVINAPEGPWLWLGFLDVHVPLRPVDLIVVREFFKQTLEDLQQLRRDGWTFLQIGEARCFKVEFFPEDGDIKVFPTSGRGPGESWGRDVLAERVEKGVPS